MLKLIKRIFDYRNWPKINRGVIWLKIVTSLIGLGYIVILPFMTLQMSSLGITDEDIGLIMGSIPFIIAFTTPILGFLSDLLGYKYVLAWDMTMVALSSTCMHYIPRYSVGKPKFPFLIANNATNFITSIYWPVCENGTDATSVEKCEESWPALNIEDFTQNISLYVKSEEPLKNPPNLIPNNLTTFANGTFCSLVDPSADTHENWSVYYEIINHPQLLGNCSLITGNYTMTFWIVLFTTLILEMHQGNTWAVMDATAISEAAKHNSRYSYVIMYSITAQIFAPLISAATIKDGENGVNDYSLMYYVTDGILAVAFVFLLWKLEGSQGFKQDEKKSEEGGLKAIKRLFSVPLMVLLIGVMTNGICLGINMTYLFLYLQNDLDASSQLLSYISTVGIISMAVTMPIADRVIKWVGHANCIAIGVFVESAKFVVYAYVQSSPPYFALGLAGLNCIMWSFSWVAIVNYAYKLSPPHLVGTMTAVVNVFMQVLCKALASLLGGQLMKLLNWSTPDLFVGSAILCSAVSVVYLCIYHLIGTKSLDDALIKKLDSDYPDRISPGILFVSRPILSNDVNSKITRI